MRKDQGSVACGLRSAHAVAQCRLHRGTGLQAAQYVERRDGLARQFGGNVGGDDGKSEDLDVERLAGRLHGFQVRPAVAPQAEVQLVPGDRLFHRVGMAVELVANRGRMKSVRLE